MNTKHHKRRFNPWPYSIMAFFIIAIIGAVVWVGFCIGHGTDLVARDYYEQEVEYQGQLDRMKRTGRLSGLTGISYEADAAVIKIQLPADHAVPSPPGFIHLYRPSQASLDQTLALAVSSAGEQLLDAAALAPGLWDVRVRWATGGEEFFLNEKIHVGPDAL